VRTELVALAAEVVEGPLLSTQGAARRHGGIGAVKDMGDSLFYGHG